MSSFHLIGIGAVLLFAVIITVGDDIAHFFKTFMGQLNPTERELIRVCQQARKR